jgi:hypothetical protein
MIRSRGFTVIEFIVASVLTLSLVTTVSITSSTLKRTMAENRDRTAVSLYTANVMEIARGFNCGAALIPGNDAESIQIKKTCEDRLPGTQSSCPGGAPILVKGPSSGDGSWQPCIGGAGSGVLQPTVTMSSSWWPDVVDSAGTRDCSSWANATGQPGVLVRTLTVQWDDSRGVPVEPRVYREVHAYPSVQALDNNEVGWIVVFTRGDGTLVSVNTPTANPQQRIERMSVPCSTGLSVAVFPYLPAARGGTDYVVSVADGNSPVQVSLKYDPDSTQSSRKEVRL